MKRSLYILLACAALFIAGPFTGRPASAKTLDVAVPGDFIAHKTAGDEVTLKSPPGWNEEPARNGVALCLVPDDGTCSVNVAIGDSREDENLASLIDQTIEQLKQVIHKFALKGREPLTVAGVPGIRIVYDGEFQGAPLRWQQTMIYTPAHTYIVTATSRIENFGANSKIFDQMLASLAVK